MDNTNLHNFDLSLFKKAHEEMIATNEKSYSGGFGRSWGGKTKDYTEEEIKNIINSNDLARQRELSNAYFNKGGYYKQLILHYSSLLKYIGILIPSPTQGKKLSTSHIQKRYFSALDYVEKMNVQIFCADCARKALIDGCYYGLIVSGPKDTFSVLDLPVSYCKTRFKDFEGNDIIEFDLSYFNTITDPDKKKAALAAYPDVVVKAYRKFLNGKGAKDVMIPSELGICFPMMDEHPFFLGILPATIQYDTAVETELERDKEEIRKIIVQEIPHLNDGRLLFEPDEALEIHKGTVGMVRNNKNTSVITTYGNVTAIGSKGSNENTNSSLERMQQNIYSQAGVSKEIFAATGGNTTDVSLKYDTSIMMTLANKFSRFITNVLNNKFSNANIIFKYTILPITYYNENEYINNCHKLTSSGYSLIMPALAQGLSQRDLVNIKDLENDVLDLTSKLIPPQTSFTQNGEDSDANGRPVKEAKDKKDQTIRNEKSIEKTESGGSK